MPAGAFVDDAGQVARHISRSQKPVVRASPQPRYYFTLAIMPESFNARNAI